MPWLRSAEGSLATTTTLTSSIPAAIARSRPRSFSTSPIQETWPRGSRGATRLGVGHLRHRAWVTKLVASIRRAPVATSA